MQALIVRYDDLDKFASAQMDALRQCACSKSFEQMHMEVQKVLGAFQELDAFVARHGAGYASDALHSVGDGFDAKAIFRWIIPRLEWLGQQMQMADTTSKNLARNMCRSVLSLPYDAEVSRILADWVAEDEEDPETVQQLNTPEVLGFYLALDEQLRMMAGPFSELMLGGDQLRRIAIRCFLMILDFIEYMPTDYLSEEEYQNFIGRCNESWYVLEWLNKAK